MAVLKSLTFTALPQPGANPTLDRRVRVCVGAAPNMEAVVR
jgi:hypothetical protein